MAYNPRYPLGDSRNPNAAADIDPAHGYDGESTDLWTNNFATDQAMFGNPA